MNARFRYKLKKIIPKRIQKLLINLIYYSRMIFFRGNNVCCPCCNTNFRKFYSSGKFGECPKCGSGSRHRLLFLYLKKRTNFFNAKLKVLHFAPEHCLNKIFSNLPNISYLSADLGSTRAMEVIDMTNINYPGNYFDVILSNHVLEHIQDDKKAMSELFRVLKSGGWSIHQVPIDCTRDKTFEDPNIKTDREREIIYGHHDHKRIYGKDFIKRLKYVGFIASADSYANEFSIEEAQKFGINQNSKIYYCQKI